ncbi:MAG: sigma-70 family RNA polymerase sigma factor [Planctomycetota bacterium]
MPEEFEPFRPADALPGNDPFDRVIERYWSLVLSVCRAQVSDHHEAEDAAQETFIKFMRHREQITGNVGAWLTATARTTAIDHVRRAIRQRARREGWVDSPARAAADPKATLSGHAVRRMLSAALLEIDSEAAELLVSRYLEAQPLRVIALQKNISIPTLSRRSSQALDQLAAVLGEMGVVGAGSLPLTVYLANLREADDGWTDDYYRDNGLSYATHRFPEATDAFPGWDRPLRVGMSLSYINHINFTENGFNSPVEFQARPSQWIDHPGVQLVGVIEPRTSHYGLVESTLRDFELNAGLIDITDVESLQTLDVILMPNRLTYLPQYVRPVLKAVRSGVGLFQEGNASCTRDGAAHDPDLCEYLLARPPVLQYCSGKTPGSLVGHSLPVPGTVVNPHPAFPWLGRGQEVTLLSCGTVYRPAAHATVIALRDEPLRAADDPSEPYYRYPGALAGPIGQGRAVIINMVVGDSVFGDAEQCPKRMLETLAWLAEPRRELPA